MRQAPGDTFAGMSAPSVDDLIRKYDVPVPRYTSYPTVPSWQTELFTAHAYEEAVKRVFRETNATKGISLYIHLPFCESLCTYCACNTRITKNHAVEEPYMQSILAEWHHYLNLFDDRPVIREVHLGGGTPTFFHPDHLRALLEPILQSGIPAGDAQLSFEGHPNNTLRAHLETLGSLGFRRVSFGVQDLDEKVQKAIHRIQPFAKLEEAVRNSRETGYTSVSFDLVYGLPFQTEASVRNTVSQLITLKPDRIAFYSYAHVPWIRPGQRGYEDADLPGDVVKRKLYEAGRELFLNAGYEDIGMDHFSLPGDELSKARREGYLHRNFMGYTTTQSELLIGLGASAISDAKYAYGQNLKKVEDYSQAVTASGHAVSKGHILSEEDRTIRKAILDLACRGTLEGPRLHSLAFGGLEDMLGGLEKDGLITRPEGGVQITPTGKMFIRNICSALDRYLVNQTTGNLFSRAI
jgi:oxygen-independent coproporphyrinogen III oxidase